RIPAAVAMDESLSEYDSRTERTRSREMPAALRAATTATMGRIGIGLLRNRSGRKLPIPGVRRAGISREGRSVRRRSRPLCQRAPVDGGSGRCGKEPEPDGIDGLDGRLRIL